MNTGKSFCVNASVGIHPGTRNLVFVLIDDRAAFDAIPLDESDNGDEVGADDVLRVLTKHIKQDGLEIFIQHWPNSYWAVKPEAQQ